MAAARRGGGGAYRYVVCAGGRPGESGGGGRDFSGEGTAGVAGAADLDQFAGAGADAGTGFAGEFLPVGERVLAGAADDRGGSVEPVAVESDGEYTADRAAVAAEQNCEPLDRGVGRAADGDEREFVRLGDVLEREGSIGTIGGQDSADFGCGRGRRVHAVDDRGVARGALVHRKRGSDTCGVDSGGAGGGRRGAGVRIRK